MGNIIFTARKILDNSADATWVADGGDLVLKAMGVVSQKGDSGVELLIGDVPDKPVEETKSRCIVQVRPKSGWRGEFGFDWYRVGDTKMAGDLPYADIVGRYYTKDPEAADAKKNTDGNSWTAFFRKDPQPPKFTSENRLTRLQALYGSFNYTMGKEKDGKPAIKPYYFPRLALFARSIDPKTKKVTEEGSADLELHIAIDEIDGKKEKPIRLDFEIDDKIADEKHPLVTVTPATLPGSKLGNRESIKIPCNSEFDTDKDLKIWAVVKDKDGKEEHLLAGLLKIIAPSKKRILDVVVVNVTTDSGSGSRKSLDQFNRNLRQALIFPNVTQFDAAGLKITIDISNPAKNADQLDWKKCYNVVKKNIKKPEGNGTDLIDFLDKQLELTFPGKYTDHFKLYFFYESCEMVDIKDSSGTVVGNTSTAGYSFINSSHGIMFKDHTPSTIGHECMHGLGLQHTFFDSEVSFKAMETDNIMDYSHLSLDKITHADRTPKNRISSNYWQWKLMNSNI